MSGPTAKRGGKEIPRDDFPILEAEPVGDLSAGGRSHRAATRVVSTNLAEVKPERVEWLWPGHIALGKMSFLEGDPATGKSTVALDLAARATTGAAWPDGSPNTVGPSSVVLLNAEDGLADTVRPRLDAAGADPARVSAVVDVARTVPGADEPVLDGLAIPRDVAALAAEVRRLGARLVVVDVLNAYLGSEVNSHSDHEVRRALTPLFKMAERTRCAVLMVKHLNKGTGKALYRGGGSIAFSAIVRSSFVTAKAPGEDDGLFGLACQKINIGPFPESLSYRLEGQPNGMARVVWEGALPGVDADGLLAAPQAEADRPVLRSILGYLETRGGTAPKAEVVKALVATGLSKGPVYRAGKRAVDAGQLAEDSGQWVVP